MEGNPEVTVRLRAAWFLIRGAIAGRLPLVPAVKGAVVLVLRAVDHRIRP